jgi:RNA polymerase sigma-70 factor (ECF subfamily)
MSQDCEHLDTALPKATQFATTHWSVVLAAGQGESPRAMEALESLCRTYWYPLYAFVRRQGHGPHDTEDLIQEFFARLLQRGDFVSVRREKGRFRSFLLVAVKHFLVNQALRARTQKRGGGQRLIPLDELLAERQYRFEPADELTPETLFERRWALALLDKVLARVRNEYESGGKLRQFEALRPFLSDGQNLRPQAEIAAELGTTEGAIKQALRLLRRRYRELLRQEVAHTVATAGDVEDELRHLVAVLRG